MAAWVEVVLTITALAVSPFGVAALSNSSEAQRTTPLVKVVTKLMPSTTPASVKIVPDIVVTIAVIGACALLGIGIAKLADIIYDKHIARYSKKEVSDNTRKLLRARVAVMRMKPDPKALELKFAKNAASMWMSKTAGKKEVIDPKSSSVTNEIGTTHVPGIVVEKIEEDRTDLEPGKAHGATDLPILEQTKTDVIELSAAKQNSSKTPEIPAVATVPKVPTVPMVPTLPSVPTVPTLPTTPTVPTMPRAVAARELFPMERTTALTKPGPLPSVSSR